MMKARPVRMEEMFIPVLTLLYSASEIVLSNASRAILHLSCDAL